MRRVLFDADENLLGLLCTNHRAGDAVAAMVREGLATFALLTGSKYGNSLALRRVQNLGFRAEHLDTTFAKHTVQGDVFIATTPRHLRAWKAKHPNGTALLWHSPLTWNVADDDAWFRVCDWDIVRWFARGGYAAHASRLAACS